MLAQRMVIRIILTQLFEAEVGAEQVVVIVPLRHVGEEPAEVEEQFRFLLEQILL